MSDLTAPKTRPQFRNLSLWQIVSYHLPAAGWVSILHRVSGTLLFLLGLPFSLYLFDQSITSELSFERYQSVVGSWPGKFVVVALSWAFIHHALAGIRYLLLDLHWGIDKRSAQLSARGVLGLSLLLTAVVVTKIFGLF